MPTFYERAGSETAANNLTPGFQTSPRITYLANGKYVVTWVTNAGASPDDIQARIFNADGTAFTDEFTVNAITAAHQAQVDITALTGGGFVVTWSDPGVNYEIRARIFDASGGIVSPADIAINDPAQTHNIIGDQLESVVVGLSGGRFAIAWTDFGGSDGAGHAGPDAGIRTRVFNADGTAASGDTLVNTQTVNAQEHPAIARLGTGYVVTWQDGSGGAGQGVDIRAQRFDVNGAKIGGEILVTSAASTQERPAVVELANGNFVIAWVDFSATGGDTSSTAIMARIFSAAGVPIGSELLLNSTTNGAQYDVALARLADGGFVATFTDIGQNAGDTSFDAVRARTFDANGAPTSVEFLVNTSTASGQYESAVASDANGNFAIVFRNDGPGNPDISFQRFAVDASPTLTGLASSVTFTESAVNGAPQLLDADVVLTDDSGNFAGETLTVSGGLAEDMVAIRNQGSAAGEIGVSGGNVSYGGVTIGTVTGGNGTTPLSVALNASATTAAVDALIQNLTYANASNTPTASRTLTLNITDGGGFAGAGTFNQLIGTANPFNGIDVGLFSDPELIDLDGDGDLDLVVGAQTSLQVYRNDGAGQPFMQLTGSANPFNGIAVGDDVSPSFVDLDGDGDLDAVIGNFNGQLIAARNNGAGAAFTVISGGANPFNGISFGTNAASAFIDFDGDGDLDTVTSSTSTSLRAFRNNGDGVAVTELTGAANPFAGLTVGSNGKIGALDFDFDGDGDLVLAAGNAGPLEAYRNNGPGQAFTALTGAENPFNGISTPGNGTIGFGDFDRDGDTDFVLGMTAGTLSAFRNDTATGRTIVVNVTAQNDVPVAQPDAVSTPENVIGTGSLLVDNGSGPDTDADGDTITVSEVNGSPADVGMEITLASGAKLTVSSDGTYSYNPNGKFNRLTDNSSGAVNTSQVGDTFSYTVTGGNTVTVTVTVNGVAGPGDWLMGDATDNTITGTPQIDTFVLSQGGNDTISALASDDIIYFGGALTPADVVNGGLGYDTVVLQGNYSGLILDSDLAGIEAISFLAGTNTAFGGPGTNLYDYHVTTSDSNFSAIQVRVNGTALLAGEDLTFDGSAETDSSYVVYGGQGTDDLTGGAGNDIFFFAGGRFAAGDSVDGGGGYDGLFLRGNYTIDFTQVGYAGALSNLENLTLSGAADERRGRGGGTEFDYSITWDGDLLAGGATMTVNGSTLGTEESLAFNGSDETDGNFRLFGGASNDVLTGGAGADLIFGGLRGDTLTGGAGNDIFRYDSVAESNSTERDGIQDFNAGDLIDLSRIDANTLVGGNQAFNFVGSAAFSNTAGELRFENISLGGPIWLVQGDTDGNGISDFEVVLIISPADPITASDFIL